MDAPGHCISPEKKHTQDIIKTSSELFTSCNVSDSIYGLYSHNKELRDKTLWTYIQDDSGGKVSILRSYNIGHCEKKISVEHMSN